MSLLSHVVIFVVVFYFVYEMRSPFHLWLRWRKAGAKIRHSFSIYIGNVRETEKIGGELSDEGSGMKLYVLILLTYFAGITPIYLKDNLS